MPFVTDTVTVDGDVDGIRSSPLVFVTSAYASYSACRQYQDDLVAAAAEVDGAVRRTGVSSSCGTFSTTQGSSSRRSTRLRAALLRGGRAEPAGQRTRLVFVAHSILGVSMPPRGSGP